MPSGNQGRSRDQGRHPNGGLGEGLHEARQNAGQHLQEGAEYARQQVREGYDTARDEMGRRYRHVEGMMVRNPTSSVLIGFGIGFGLGLVVTSMFGERERETWAERNLPGRLRQLPDSLQDTIEQLTESVRQLPDAIRSHLPAAMRGR